MIDGFSLYLSDDDNARMARLVMSGWVNHLYAYNPTGERGHEHHIVVVNRPGTVREERKLSTPDLSALLLILEVEWKTSP